MKKYSFLLPIILLSTHTIFGQAIDSSGCTGAVGDVKYSILAEVEFQGENGDCWVLMDGRDVTGSHLDTGFSINTLPDVRGYFIRCYDNRQTDRVDVDRSHGESIATVQNDEIKSHDHGIHLRGDPGDTGGTNKHPAPFKDDASGPYVQTLATGGAETRPKNITLYTYIRIN